jgi:hypothetical protein
VMAFILVLRKNHLHLMKSVTMELTRGKGEADRKTIRRLRKTMRKFIENIVIFGFDFGFLDFQFWIFNFRFWTTLPKGIWD